MRDSGYDIIVVGAGHAGVEASLASSRLGLRTLLITTKLDRIAYMSCNPSIGGLAKGHMVREIDVLGGEMGFVADETCIQYKRLNSSKGPAVRGTRVQSDKARYSRMMGSLLRAQPGLTLFQGEVRRLLIEGETCVGVVLQDGSEVRARATVITTGTFLNGVMHIGHRQEDGGRIGDAASKGGISDQLSALGFTVRRLKTGTPPRLLKDSIDWSRTTPQSGDSRVFPFSTRSGSSLKLPQIECFLSRTTEETHEVIRRNLHLSPMYCGIIEGVGPRYCPSIEDKIVRFADRNSHQTFLEPEGLETDLVYLQGISTSLPEEVQELFLRTIPGLENVKVASYGYAVEYDFIEPTQIWHRLETRPLRRLYLAGQINGTSGYEEAAAQGFVAGVNAAHAVLERPEFILGRDQAYIGVLIDDLVTKGTNEPYRMFTSRAEHRLVLREDNTVDRLANVSGRLKVASSERLDILAGLRGRRESLRHLLRSKQAVPNEETQAKLISLGSAPLLKPQTLEELLRRPELSALDLVQFGLDVDEDARVHEAVEIDVKYAGYVRRQMELIEQSRGMESRVLPEDLDYRYIRGLSNEEVQKLSRVRPRTLGQAQRISGVNPSAIQAIMVFLKGHHGSQEGQVVRSREHSSRVEN